MPDRQVKPLMNELRAMKERMDALYLQSCGRGPESARKADTEGAWSPAVDIMETETGWLFVLDVPGVQEEDVRVEVVENTLAISGNKPTLGVMLEGTNGIPKVLRHDRSHGPFDCTLEIPFEAQQDAIRADLKDGVLTITVPKRHSPHAPQRKIIVHSE